MVVFCKFRYTFRMTRPSMLITLGIILVLLPFSGLPIAWRSFLLPVAGVAVLAIGISLRGPRAMPPLDFAASKQEPEEESAPPTHPQAMG